MKKFLLIMLILALFVSSVSAFDMVPSTTSFNTGVKGTVSSNFKIINSGNTSLKFDLSSKNLNLSSVSGSKIVSLSFNPSSSSFEVKNKTNSSDISYSFILPESMVADTYTGKISLMADNGNTSSFNITVNLTSVKSLSIPAQLHFGDLYYNQSRSKDFIIKNNGSVKLNSIHISTNASSKFNFQLNPTSFSLNPGESKTITAYTKLPDNLDFVDNLVIGNLKVDADGSELDKTISDFFKTDVFSYLNVDRVEFTINGESEKVDNGDLIKEKAHPLSKVKIEVELENLWDDIGHEEIDINDVTVEIKIKDINDDNDDIEYKSGDEDLSFEGNERKHLFTYEFEVPVDAIEDTYDVEISIDGEDDEKNDFNIEWVVEMEIKRESHNLVVTQFRLSDDTITCSDDLIADLEIINIGDDDEDYVRYTIKEDTLGIDIVKSRFEIVSDYKDKENVYKESIPIDISNFKEGTYEIDLRVYRDFDLIEDAVIRQLKVNPCSQNNNQQNSGQTTTTTGSGSQTNTANQDSLGQQTNTGTSSGQQDTNVDTNAGQDTKKDVTIPGSKSSDQEPILGLSFLNKGFTDTGAYIVLLVLLYVFVITAAILMIMVLKRK